MAGIACWVVAVEMKIVFSRVLTTQRDLGLLVFAEHIKAKHFTGDMYYLQPGNGLYGTWGFKNMTMPQADSLYAMTYEADIMRVAMLEKGESGLNVHSLSLKSQLSFPAFFYVLKSPLISFDELSSWAANNKLSVTQMDSYPVVNLPRRTVEEPFRFYAVRKVP